LAISAFSAVQEILNLISGSHSQTFYMWDHVEKDVNWHMQWMFDNLERGEVARLKEIEEQFNL